ncbi:MAG: serine hydrolase domain-containing protein, partial [bacterium]
MRRSIGAVLVLMLAQACASAGTTSTPTAGSPLVNATAKARIDSTLNAFVASGRASGASALVWEKGREVYFGAYGMADREAGRPMRRDAIAQIFSMTKPITGVALMQLFEQGKFQLDEPLAKYLPEFSDVKVYAGKDANGAPQFVAPDRAPTIRDITRHTAGFATNAGDPGVGQLFRTADPMNRNNTISVFSRRLASVPLSFEPGTKWSYDISVNVQAALVERLSGEPFGRYVRTHVLDPLGMRETRYFVPERDRGRFAAMYQRGANGELTRAPDSTAKAFNTKIWPLEPGSFGFTSTLDDYMRLARMLLGGGQLGGVRILKPETVRLMATNHL